MAGTYGSTVSFSIPCNKFTICRAKPLLSVSSSISISSRSKLPRRKNHLRIKILKTLTKPPPFTVSPIPPESESSTPIVLPEISGPSGVETEVLSPAESCPSSTATDGESRLSESSDTASLLNFDVAKFSWGSFVRFGVYLLAVFAFQTICTVWVLEYGSSIKEDKNSDEGLSVRRKSGRELLLNGNERIILGNFGSKTNKLVYLEETKMREKIEEIRLMAKAARIEEKNKISDDIGEDDMEGGNVISRARIGIEKEVDARLVKLEKRLNSAKEKIPDSPVNYLLKSENVEDAVERKGFNGEERNKSLMFKKKLKYRNSSSDRMKKPMGFQGFVSNGKKGGSNGKGTTVEGANFVGGNMGMKDTNKRVDNKIKDSGVDNEIKDSVSEMFEDDDTNFASNGSVLPRENDRTNLDIGTKVSSSKNKPSNGVVQETSSVEISKSQNLEDVMEKRSPSVSSDDSVRMKSMAGEDRGKQTNKKADLWWLNLPYVLVIFMNRGSNDEELEGLFTLKIPSKTQDIEESTYTVAFEDHVDANNFCYLLESFFEELDNFTTDVVPLPTKELEKVIKSRTSKMIVVKKKQLQLYAGQPFDDVETALRALVERNENVISLHFR
ncbi:uncharacterized protein LOC120068224 [Benincasa hispida]|uniref:uncharacterized protein LOC120068224 n=1 Tax=Benincasa hispida TaxID=102211 RepID=UPI00190270FE|nr:uncharacterized protein LOC120068224 [Benincasa hispida]